MSIHECVKACGYNYHKVKRVISEGRVRGADPRYAYSYTLNWAKKDKRVCQMKFNSSEGE